MAHSTCLHRICPLHLLFLRRLGLLGRQGIPLRMHRFGQELRDRTPHGQAGAGLVGSVWVRANERSWCVRCALKQVKDGQGGDERFTQLLRYVPRWY